MSTLTPTITKLEELAQLCPQLEIAFLSLDRDEEIFGKSSVTTITAKNTDKINQNTVDQGRVYRFNEGIKTTLNRANSPQGLFTLYEAYQDEDINIATIRKYFKPSALQDRYSNIFAPTWFARSLSHYKIFEEKQNSSKEWIMVVESAATLSDDFLQQIQAIVAQLPKKKSLVIASGNDFLETPLAHNLRAEELAKMGKAFKLEFASLPSDFRAYSLSCYFIRPALVAKIAKKGRYRHLVNDFNFYLPKKKIAILAPQCYLANSCNYWLDRVGPVYSSDKEILSQYNPNPAFLTYRYALQNEVKMGFFAFIKKLFGG